jgi:uncharacterized protein
VNEPGHDLLVVFTRYPVAGGAKTRLISSLGAEGAAQLQREMTGHAVLTARGFCIERGGRMEVRFSGGSRRMMRRWLGGELRYVEQGEGDLGRRMGRAVEEAAMVGARRIVIMGTDCPGIDVVRLGEAFGALETNDVVIGPAGDGGYYLIGVTRPRGGLFEGVPWGSGEVLGCTLQKAKRLSLRTQLLGELRDVDTVEDLPVWAAVQAGVEQRVSVIIPTLNEEGQVGAAVRSALRADVEVLVVDGGSGDDTIESARRAGGRVLCTAGGRAAQMNVGAISATGEVLLFLHADTVLPVGWVEAVRWGLNVEGVVAGAFSLGLSGEGRSKRLVAGVANLRSRWGGLPYGDQGLFVRRERFRASGGYALMPIMEDYEWMGRMRRLGKVLTLGEAVRTSDRRWQRLGVVRTAYRNALMVGGYHLGVPIEVLARMYRHGT